MCDQCKIQSLTLGILPPAFDPYLCGLEKVNIGELDIAIRPHRMKKVNDVMQAWFKETMQAIEIYEIAFLKAFGLPSIDKIRKFVTGNMDRPDIPGWELPGDGFVKFDLALSALQEKLIGDLLIQKDAGVKPIWLLKLFQVWAAATGYHLADIESAATDDIDFAAMETWLKEIAKTAAIEAWNEYVD